MLQEEMETLLKEKLDPFFLEVINESDAHQGHVGKPSGNETHFRLRIGSKKFEGLNRVAQHRLIHDAIRSPLEKGIHALAIEIRKT